MSTPAVLPIGPDQKYCSECGKVILRRAEICPGCGCRQFSAPQPASPGAVALRANVSPELQSPFVGRMILLIALNVLWSGLGNLAVGDKRGWGFLLLNILIFTVGLFMMGIPIILFFAYCTYAGYQFLVNTEMPKTG